jgi:translocator protein
MSARTHTAARPDRTEHAGSRWWALLGFVAVMFLAGAIGGFATDTGPGSWYAGLEQPAWNPPDWLFAPVWTTLYVLIGVATWLTWRAGGRAARPALTLFGVQVVLNAGWSVVFFGLEQVGWALVVIVALWVVIAGMIVTYARWSRTAAWLLAPYLAWVTFATALNAAILRLN